MTVILPKVAAVSKYRPNLVDRLKLIIQSESKGEAKELAGKALFFVCPEIKQEEIDVNPAEIAADLIIWNANLILGYTAKFQSLDPRFLKKSISTLSLVSQKSNSSIPSAHSMNSNDSFLLLKAIVLYDQIMNENVISVEEVMTSFKALFPLSYLKSTSYSKNNDFGMDQQCLWVTSEWLFAHQCNEGIDYCRNLAKAAFEANTAHSMRLFGSIWWEITLPLLPSAIDGMKLKADPEAQKARALAIGRLLRICPHTPTWSQMVQNWAKLGCANYTREIRGDVGSWTRSATLSCMNDLLRPFQVDFSSREWTGYANVGKACEDEPVNGFFPLSVGSCLFPDSKCWGLEEEKGQASLDGEIIDCFVRLALKQIMEQHTRIRQLAADLLFGLDRSTPLIQMVIALIPAEHQNSSSASMPELTKCLIGAVKLPTLRPTLLRGLIYTVGGNAPRETASMSKELIEVIGEESTAKAVFPELVAILKEEASAHRNGFYPALRTLILCCESVDLEMVLDPKLQGELYHLIPKLAVWQTKNANAAVVKSLLDLYALMLPLWTPERNVIAPALPFLEYPNAVIRNEAAQVLYMHCSMNGIEPEAQTILESGSFGSASFKESVAALQSLCSLSCSVCATNNPVRSVAS